MPLEEDREEIGKFPGYSETKPARGQEEDLGSADLLRERHQGAEPGVQGEAAGGAHAEGGGRETVGKAGNNTHSFLANNVGYFYVCLYVRCLLPVCNLMF